MARTIVELIVIVVDFIDSIGVGNNVGNSRTIVRGDSSCEITVHKENGRISTRAIS